MRRREFIRLLGSAAASPFAARAQQGAIRRVGVLMGFAESDHGAQSGVAVFREELRKLGWTEGRNIEIDIRWATAESMQAFAKELVALQPDFILTSSTPATAAMVQSTHTIPIIFVMVSDPVGSGFVASLPRPGRDVTGFTAIEGSLGGKWVELLKEIAPQVARVVLLFNPTMAPYAEYYLHPFKVAAESLGVEAIVARVHGSSELESVVATQARAPNSGLIIMPDAFIIGHRAEITSLAARYRVPAVYWSRFFAEVGGLISYGPNGLDEYSRAASYADRILRGAKPSELPVQAQSSLNL